MRDPHEERRGRALAVAMLRELHTEWAAHDLGDIPDEWVGEAMIAREPSILRHYLTKSRAGGEDLELGFLRVLSDYLGGTIDDQDDEFLRARYEGARHG